MSRKWLLFVTIVCLFFTLGAAQSTKSYDADRFDVEAVVQTDGSLLVTETVVFNFHGEPFTYVFRELPTEYTDGIADVVGAIDGRTLPPGDQPGQLEISGRNPLRITWHFEPIRDASRTFSLTYRLRGLVRQANDQDILIWQPLPDNYEYPIAASLVRLSYPAAAVPLGEPEIQAGSATVTMAANQVSFSQQNLSPNTPLVIALRFPQGSLISAPPHWQQQVEAREKQAPLWVGAAAVVLLMGVGATIILSASRRQSVPVEETLRYEPPQPLPAAFAHILYKQGTKPDWNAALATLFSLAQRGVLVIEENPEKKWYRGRDFIIKLAQEPSGLLPHEESLLVLLFETKKGRSRSVGMAELSQRISSRAWGQFRQTLCAEFTAAGLLDSQQQQTKRRWTIAGILFILGGLVVTIPMMLILYTFSGLWPLLLAGSAIIVGFVMLIVSGLITPLSRQGVALASQWRSFAAYLKQVIRNKAAATRPDIFDLYLPYAASFGILHGWARYFEKKGGAKLPPWFQTLTAAPDEAMGAFVAMTVASSASGGSAAGATGAAAAGAAGGGASGAG